MSRQTVFIGLVVFALMIAAPAVCQDSPWLMHGTVTWDDGSPAVSVKLRLMKGDNEIAVVYTNPEGGYGYYDIPGRPSDYTLEVWLKDRLIKKIGSTEMQSTERGERLDIRLDG